MGREIVLAFTRAGYAVAFCYKEDRSAAEKTKADAAGRSSSDLRLFQCDVADSAAVGRMFLALRKLWSRLDVLVNNAAVTGNELIVRQSVADWDAVLATNLSGAFHCMRESAAWMKECGGGHIVNVSSISGIRGREGQAAYAASKAGLIGLTKSAAMELGRSDVRVNAVLPGLLSTAMATQMPIHQRERQLSDAALGRTGDAAEVAQFIVRLSEMSNVSGQIFNVDSRVLP